MYIQKSSSQPLYLSIHKIVMQENCTFDVTFHSNDEEDGKKKGRNKKGFPL